MSQDLEFVNEADLEKLRRATSVWERIRVLLFLVFIGALFTSFAGSSSAGVVAIACLIIFPLVVIRHDRLDHKRRSAVSWHAVAESEQLRRENVVGDAAAPGSGFLDFDPPLPEEIGELDAWSAADLGITEGRRSLFAWVETVTTPFGAQRLEELLRRPLTSKAHLERRQAAVRELAENDGARRRLLHQLELVSETPLASPDALFAAELELAGNSGLRRWAVLFGTLAPIALAAVFFYTPAVLALIALIGVNGALITSYNAKSQPARERLLRLIPLLDVLNHLETAFATGELEEEEWRGVAQRLEETGPARRRLRRSLTQLSWRELGPLFEVINMLVLLELRLLPKLESLFEEQRPAIGSALVTLGHVEALLSFACALADRPGTTLPKLSTSESPVLVAKGLVHPGLDPRTRVGNPIRLGLEDEKHWIITGSNMAGKSTYLKTVGVNVALANAGGPVCAESFEWTPMTIVTDINVRDSLDDGKSYFQVEVERVLRVIELAPKQPLLALLDELFRGTNASERYSISWALLDQLRSSPALVLAATHDDRLAERVDALGAPQMANVHFPDRVEAGHLVFDYAMRRGRAQARNAIQVLDQSGYPSAVVEEARRLQSERDGE